MCNFRKVLAVAAAISLLCAAPASQFLTLSAGSGDAAETSTHAVVVNTLSEAGDIGYWTTPDMTSIVEGKSPYGNCMQYVPNSNTSGTILLPLDNSSGKMKDAKALAFWVDTPEVTDKTFSLFFDVFDRIPNGDTTADRRFSGKDNSFHVTLVSTEDGSKKEVTPGWSFALPCGFTGYVVVSLDNMTYAEGSLEDTPMDVSTLWQFGIRPDWNQSHMVGQNVYIDNVCIITDIEGFASDIYDQVHPTAQDPHASHADNANMTVGNGMSSEADLGWKNVTTEFVDTTPDKSGLKFTTSSAGRQLNFPISTAANKQAFKDAEAVVFWIKTPKMDSSNVDMFMNVFDTIDGTRTERGISNPRPDVTVTTVSAADGTVKTEKMGWYLPISSDFEGYVIIPKTTWTNFNSEFFSEVQIWFESSEATFLLDDIGVTTDVQTYIDGLKALYAPDPGSDDKVDHTKHEDNANMTVGCGMESMDDITYKSVEAEVVAGVSPDGSCIKYQPAVTGGEINFRIDNSNRAAFEQAKAIVFWMKTPNVAECCSYLQVYDRRPGDVSCELFGMKNSGDNLPSFRVVWASDGHVETIQGGWYWNIPGNFEGYVILDTDKFTTQSEYVGIDNRQFDIDYFNEMKLFFEPSKPVAGEDFYIDDIGVTADPETYIAGLKALYGGDAKPEDHAKHPDNKGVVVANGFDSQTSFNHWTSSYIQTGFDTTVSPDKKAGKFVLASGTQGEVYFAIDYENNSGLADGKALIFWFKTPDSSPSTFFLDVASVKDAAGNFDKFIQDPSVKHTMTFVSAKDGTAKTYEYTRGFQLPSNFEGYAIIPVEDFSVSGFDISKWNLMVLRPDWGQETLVGEDFFIDDIGAVADPDAVIQNLAELYKMDAPDPGEEGGEGDDDNTPAYQKGPLTADPFDQRLFVYAAW